MNLPLYGLLSQIHPILIGSGVVVAVGTLGFFGARLGLWAVSLVAGMLLLGAPAGILGVFAMLAVVLHVRPLRRQISRGVMKLMTALDFLPAISRRNIPRLLDFSPEGSVRMKRRDSLTAVAEDLNATRGSGRRWG